MCVLRARDSDERYRFQLLVLDRRSDCPYHRQTTYCHERQLRLHYTGISNVDPPGLRLAFGSLSFRVHVAGIKPPTFLVNLLKSFSVWLNLRKYSPALIFSKSNSYEPSASTLTNLTNLTLPSDLYRHSSTMPRETSISSLSILPFFGFISNHIRPR